MSTIGARLARLEQRSQLGPAPVHFTIVTSDDEGGPGRDDEGRPARWFTIRLDKPGSDEEAADA